ncbi:MAG TPA: hypothetical protein VF290_02450 [Pyrinomonadaceae bacterium]
MRDEKDQALARRFQDEAWTIGELIATVRAEERKATFKDAIKIAQQSAKKSQAASLDIAAAEILIRRLEIASENRKGEG